MSFSRFTGDMNIISSLQDKPNEPPDSYSAGKLKAAFDEGPNRIKDFINNTLLPALEDDSAAANIGVSSPVDDLVFSNVQEAIEALSQKAESTGESAETDAKAYADNLKAASDADLIAAKSELENDIAISKGDVESQLRSTAANLSADIELVRNETAHMVSTPLMANSSAEMTDTSKVYVYTGSTGGGLTNGHWYYWNGSAWADGGVYNSVAFSTDTTLAVSGAAADAKSAGDAVNKLNETNANAKLEEDASRLTYHGQIRIPCNDGKTVGGGGTAWYEKYAGIVNFNYANQPYSNLREPLTGEVSSASSSAPTYARKPEWYVDDIPDFVVGNSYYFGLKLLSGTMSDGAEPPSFVLYTKDGSLSGKTVLPGSIWKCNIKPQCIALNFKSGAYDDCYWYFYIIDQSAPGVKNAEDDSALIPMSGQFQFVNGGFTRTGSSISDASSIYYLVMGDYAGENIKKVSVPDAYRITVIAFENNSFAGFLSGGSSHISNVSSDSVFYANEISLEDLRNSYPGYQYRIEIVKAETAAGTNTRIYESEASNLTLYAYRLLDYASYYADEMEKTVLDVYKSITEPAIVFPTVTDIHFLSIKSSVFNQCARNIAYFCENVSCDFVLNLGDNTDGNIAPEDTIARNLFMQRKFARINAPYLQAIGNHDTNYYNGATKLSGTETFASYLANVKGVTFDTEDRAFHFDFFKDFDVGIRLAVLDADYLAQYRYHAETAEWLSNVVLDTDKTVVLCEHLSSIATQNWAAQALTYGDDVTAALQTFVNNGGNLIQLCGHSHADYWFSAPWLTVYSCCQKLEQQDTSGAGYQAIVGNEGSIVAPARERLSASEDLWSVFIVKPDSGTVSSIRFGAGSDRHFHYKPIVVSTDHTLTSVLSGTLTWTTSDASVATVSAGVVTAVGTGKCQVTATNEDGDFETWAIQV